VGERTALINQLRAFLLERGIAVAQGRRKLELHLQTLLAAREDQENNASVGLALIQSKIPSAISW
jgi:hypothetical protein